MPGPMSLHETHGARRWVLAVLPLALVTSGIPLWHLWRDGYWLLVGEDRSAEVLTCLAYAATAALGLLIAVRLHRAGLRVEAALWLLLGLGAFLVAGEEVSWGQRQLGFAGPEAIVRGNLQGEANLHNLLGRYALHGVYLLVALSAGLLARVVVPRVRRLRDHPWLFVPGWDLAPWFGACFAFYVWFDYADPVFRRLLGPGVDVVLVSGPKLEELAELAMAGGFLLFAARVAVAIRGPGLRMLLRTDGALEPQIDAAPRPPAGGA